MGEFVKAAKRHEIPSETGKYVQIKGNEIALLILKVKSMPSIMSVPIREARLPKGERTARS